MVAAYWFAEHVLRRGWMMSRRRKRWMKTRNTGRSSSRRNKWRSSAGKMIFDPQACRSAGYLPVARTCRWGTLTLTVFSAKSAVV
ncbi:hypothetical protein KCP73_20145 [Salmonella enterica subsp. enterica]|nr:hypothetical protein KCP73_20145 [Salmonella enterica subsp. enterica]